MKVLLVCSMGITTNILATKLQKYASQNGKDDLFTAIRISQYQELLPHTDVVLIAPQADLQAAGLKADARKIGIPFLVLDESTFVLGDVEKIYAYLDSCRAAFRKILQAKPEQVPLTVTLMGRILLNATLYSIPVLLFGGFCLVLGEMLSATVLMDASRATLSILILYFMFSLGYQYGQMTGREAVPRGFIALGAPLILLPMDGSIRIWTAPFHMAAGQISLGSFALPNALLLAALAAAAVVIAYQLDRVKFPASVCTIPMMENMVKMGAVFLLFIMLRCFLIFH